MTLHRFEETSEPHYALIMGCVVVVLIAAIGISLLAFGIYHGAL